MTGTPTPLDISEGTPWPVQDPKDYTKRVIVRRIGWIDQRGRVYTEVPPGRGFDGGSLHALLIDVED